MMSRSTTGMTALVTGGSRGIGRAAVRRLAADGYRVAFTYAADQAAAEETSRLAEEAGGRAVGFRAEFGARGDAARAWAAFDAAAADHDLGGRLDVLVNNAAVGGVAPLSALDEDEFDRVFAANVRAPLFLIREGLARLDDGARIVNVSSLAARLATPPMIAYAASKAALENVTLALAKELGPRRITVNAVRPGTVRTDSWNALSGGSVEAESAVAARAALGRIGEADDIADVIAFLASPDARWITGSVVDAGGGTAI
ncbi:SDR family oxidoreductase [Schumannella luteola]|uniref:NAD(P)-dependent dehydrogenase (Short-subunit alcohol dehydrogenase family) n=1 Tax=Schumannella luteola TaxID=472059 RepID=A0A852YMK1_9MICO|nr:SDR family oxidoreductase [Schumannella luteola]NYG98455.1 NAD(P)-dependent dehydrogenase (short-subunit alcohol dehydrogenase family) [Schumannella luteola]TPX01314.1 SDR family oxidoreductase [Schumannella luteola]